MKFLFISPIHRLKVDKVMNKGRRISEGVSDRLISKIVITLKESVKTYIKKIIRLKI